MAKRAAKVSPVKQLGLALVQQLEQHRGHPNAYPASLHDLAGQLAEPPEEELLLSAMKAAPLKSAVITAFPGEPDALAVLKQDKEQLAADPRVLKRLIEQLCSPQLPHVSIDSMAGLLSTPLRAPFKKHWKAQLKQRTLPEFAAIADVPQAKGKPKPELHDIRFPLPWVRYAQQLLEELRQRCQGEWFQCLPTAEELATSIQLTPTDPLFQQALASPP
ncbi:MAG: hypothetical protein KDA58_13515, partial [Planctomycetaceae bacterium]|nr:hypothetical protein [Planctomycetaceae bacterium]